MNEITSILTHRPTRPPRQHQWTALSRSKDKRAYFLRMETGTGKSKVAVDEMADLYMRNKIDRVMIFSKKGAYRDWLDKHIPENMPDEIPHYTYLWTRADGSKDPAARKRLNGVVSGPPVLRILVMNIEALSGGMTTTAHIVARNFVAGGRTLIICDESTSIKNYKAKRTKAIVQIGAQAVYVRALTGTAVTKSPLDLWGQLAFLGIASKVATNYFTFRARFCEMDTIYVGRAKTVQKITGYRNLDQLNSLLEPHSYRVLKEDCLDLPPKTYERYEVELTDEQRRIYREMADDLMTEFEAGKFASAKNAMGKLMAMHKILCGHITDEQGNTNRIPTRRVAALDDVIEETTGKVAIWCAYQEDVRQIMEYLHDAYPGEEAVDYYGPTKPEDRAKNLASFQNGDARFFVGTAATGGYGLTLTSCNMVIYYSSSFDLEHRLQSEDRFHRIGQVNPVTYVDLVAPKTIDEKIIKALREKKSVADAVEGDGLRAWLDWSK